MKRVLFFLILAMVVLQGVALAQNSTPTIVAAWTGVRNDGKSTYRFAGVIQKRGRWTLLDIGYIDFDHPGQYREVFIGGGGTVYDSKLFTFIAEGLINKASGPASGGALYLQPWFLAIYRLTPKINGEVVYFPYLPLNKAGRIQHVLERAKLEYDFKHLKVGGGYGAYQYGDGPWQNKPFTTTTLKGGRVGDLEVWLQKMPEQHFQVQLRYTKVFP